ncbi:MAG: hypothetical protein J5J00_10415 [Deltaproteobacteria bacterium]|nr:hypothetical protein [Deltaproteobacteria bacterium]
MDSKLLDTTLKRAPDELAAGLAPSQSQPNTERSAFQERTANILNDSRLYHVEGLSDLSALDQERVARIFSSLSEGTSQGTAAPIDQIEALLSKRAPNGELLISQTFDGKSMLEHLEALATARKLDSRVEEAGFSSTKVLSELISTLVDTGRASQDNRFTCSACGLEYALIGVSRNGTDLARYVATVKDLAVSGEFDPLSGQGTLKLPAALGSDKRSPVSNILQSAFMHYASDTGYDATTDTMGGKVGSHSGAYSRQIEKLFEGYTGRAFERVDNGRAEFESKFFTSLDEGTINVACIKGLGAGGHSLHIVNGVKPENFSQLTAQGCHTGDGYIYFRNPWGRDILRDGQGGAELVDGKESIYRLPKSEFFTRTTYVMVEGGNMGETPGATDEIERTPAVFVTLKISENNEAELAAKRMKYINQPLETARMDNIEGRTQAEQNQGGDNLLHAAMATHEQRQKEALKKGSKNSED